jgi:hypothetical protein
MEWLLVLALGWLLVLVLVQGLAMSWALEWVQELERWSVQVLG